MATHASHLGSMPSLNRWKSVPAMRREGVKMLLYKLLRREAAADESAGARSACARV